VTIGGANPSNSGPSPYGPGATVTNTLTYASPFSQTTINGQRACHVEWPFSALTQIKFNGSYPLPVGLMVSATLQSVPGAPIDAIWSAPNSAIAPSLGRNLAVCGAAAVCLQTASVPLIMPESQFLARRNQVDLRLSKIFKFGGGVTAQANVDVYNLFNSSALVLVNQTYGPSWQIPITTRTFGPGILNPRLLQVGGRINF
jgi:hypothetical protein